ncbi:MAG: PASTA domain-containing protein [Actinomycetia bacterium]|nr:PASTA domain-containing protein [Actinomycetes bacterium]
MALTDVMLPAGSRVVLIVSSGPDEVERPMTTMPQVLDLSQGTALQTIQETGLRSRTKYDYSTTTRKGAVGTQYPEAGTRLPWGSDVLVLVSSGVPINDRPPKALPQVAGLCLDEARAIIKEAGFLPDVLEVPSDITEADIVIAQTPNETAAVYQPKKSNIWAWILIALLVLVITVVGFLVMEQKGRAAKESKSSMTIERIIAPQILPIRPDEG